MPTEKQANMAKEIVAAAIGLGIACASLYMLAHTFNFGAQSFGDEGSPVGRGMKEAYVRQRELMLYGLSLLGTVLGYYLGRVPAERAEIRAKQEANEARTKLQETDANFNQTRTELTVSKEKKSQLAAATRALIRESQQELSAKKRGSTLSGSGIQNIDPDRSAALQLAIENAQEVLAD
jgi:hypothetical protein